MMDYNRQWDGTIMDFGTWLYCQRRKLGLSRKAFTMYHPVSSDQALYLWESKKQYPRLDTVISYLDEFEWELKICGNVIKEANDVYPLIKRHLKRKGIPYKDVTEKLFGTSRGLYDVSTKRGGITVKRLVKFCNEIGFRIEMYKKQ